MMKNLFLVSPVAEFHRWTPEMDVPPRNLRILEGQLQWVRGILDLNGYEVRTSLDLAEIPEQMGGKPLKTGALALLFRSDAWNRQMEEKDREAVGWCDAVVLMPECGLVASTHVGRVKSLAEEYGKPILSAEDVVKVDTGDFRKSLADIEKAINATRSKRVVLMKGGRQR